MAWQIEPDLKGHHFDKLWAAGGGKRGGTSKLNARRTARNFRSRWRCGVARPGLKITGHDLRSNAAQNNGNPLKAAVSFTRELYIYEGRANAREYKNHYTLPE